MQPTLPRQILEVFDRFVTTEYVTVDRRGAPIAWPVTPYHRPDTGCIDVTTGLGYPKKADDARHNPRVALLFSDPTGSGMSDAPMVLVQGTARVDDDDLDANRERYARESAAKLRRPVRRLPSALFGRLVPWYATRIYVHVRPERVYVWPSGDLEAEPELYDSHIDEVRAAHNLEPEEGHAEPEGGGPVWGPRLDALGTEYPDAVLAFVGPDGFPFAVRVPVRADREARVVRIGADPVGAPIEAGRACLCAHVHSANLSWWRNFQVRGDLVEDQGRWVLVPHRVLGGIELPPGGPVQQVRHNARKALRFARTARARRRAGSSSSGAR